MTDTKLPFAVRVRQHVEKRIARQCIADMLAAGYTITVFNSEEETITKSVDAKAILAAMFTTDDDVLYMYRGGQVGGWVKFVYGNDGWDVISDYSTRLDSLMGNCEKLARKFE